jgi:hypothetical protein
MSDYRILDFDIHGLGLHSVLMPIDAQLVAVLNQGGLLHVYAFCDVHADRELRTLEVIGTTEPIEDSLTIARQYVGSALMMGLAVHVFERRM